MLQPQLKSVADPWGPIAHLALPPDMQGRTQTGTAWLCSPRNALTAFHCVGDITTRTLRQGPITLHFSALHPESLSAQVQWFDADLDVALLSVEGVVPVEPLRPCTLKAASSGNTTLSWHAYSHPESHICGMILSGAITSMSGRWNGQLALQLDCDQGGYGALNGASGAAVCQGDSVIGVIHGSVVDLNQKVLFATPISEIAAALAAVGYGNVLNMNPRSVQPVHPLHAFPRAYAPFEWILPSLPLVFSRHCYDSSSPIHHTQVLLQANRFRAEADPGDQLAKGIHLSALPPPGCVPGDFFWMQAFQKACIQDGRRMVAALILMLPVFAFEGQSRIDREWLLDQLKKPTS